MSKERAQRRAEREREQAIRTAARARVEERTRLRARRREALVGWLPRPRWQPGLLARRRRQEITVTVLLLAVLNVLVWLVTPAWEVRVLFVMVSLLAAPVLHTLLFRRR
jgi:Flp pilus assembly protein TadB